MREVVRSKTFYRFEAELPSILALVDNFKLLVKYFNQACIQKLLDKTPKLENNNRWFSLYEMLESVKEGFEKATIVLHDRRKEEMISRIIKLLLIELLNLLHDFKIRTKQLESAKKPTMHMVILLYSHMLKDYDTPSVSNKMRVLKSILKDMLKSEWKLYPIYTAAAFLDPQQTFQLDTNSEVSTNVLNEGKNLVEIIFKRHKTCHVALGMVAAEKATASSASRDDDAPPRAKNHKSIF